jgi:integrase/recombinase XerD
MSLTSKIFLDNRRPKQDGTQPIKLRLTINRKFIEISMGYPIHPKYWDERKMEIKPNAPIGDSVTRLNNLIKKTQSEYIGKVIELQDSGEIASMSMKDIKNRLLGKADDSYLIMFCTTIIQENEQKGSVGNAKVYTTLKRSVSNFLKGKDIPMKKVNLKWLKDYEAWYLEQLRLKQEKRAKELKEKGLKTERERTTGVNGLGVNMRTLRALINRAIKQGMLSRDSYAFQHYSVKTEKTRKRAVSQTDIESIKDFVPTTKRQARAKDYFMASFYLMGASFVDLAFLRVSDIHNGRIEYKRKKTGKLHSIKITQQLQEILDKYLPGKGKDDFIFNVIHSTTIKQQYKNVSDELRRYNKQLKEIAKMCGIENTVTSYVARHSYASIGQRKQVPIAVISQALGHSDLKTTEIYLAGFDNEVLDSYNEQIIGS